VITKRSQILWPPVSDSKDIQLTIWIGCCAAFFYAAHWGLTTLIGAIYGIIAANSEVIGKTVVSLIHLAIATSIGWGILKRFRAAPVAGLVLSVYGFIGSCFTKGFINSTAIIMVVDTWMFIQATRGIFAYHKMKKVTEIEEKQRSNTAFNQTGNKPL
jgi:hypothetical protein